MTTDDTGLTGFATADVALPVPSAAPSPEALDRMAHHFAAAMLGKTPEEIVGYLQDGWPADVVALLAEPYELAEMHAHVNVLLHLAERG